MLRVCENETLLSCKYTIIQRFMFVKINSSFLQYNIFHHSLQLKNTIITYRLFYSRNENSCS